MSSQGFQICSAWTDHFGFFLSQMQMDWMFCSCHHLSAQLKAVAPDSECNLLFVMYLQCSVLIKEFIWRELATDPPWMKKMCIAMMSDLPFVADLKVWSSKTGQPRVMVNGTQLEVHSWPAYKRLLMGFFKLFSDIAKNREKLSNLGCTMNLALCKALCIIKNQTCAGSPDSCYSYSSLE